MAHPPAPDSVNRPTWSDPSVARELTFEGWSDPGEVSATLAVADLVRDGRLLDLGVGSGRTTSLLRLLTSRYEAVDYTPEMVAIASRRHPSESVSLGDARCLDQFDDASFDAAIFSFNGIDAVDHMGRSEVLRAVGRTLRPGGIFLFSTLNMDGPEYGRSAWRRAPLPWVVGSLVPNEAWGRRRALLDLLRTLGGLDIYLQGVRNERGLRPGRQNHDGWGIAPLAAHRFGLLVHFTTLASEAQRLDDAGFDLVTAFAAEDGRTLTAADDTRAVRWFHVLARKR